MTDPDARLQLAEGTRLLDAGEPAAALRALLPLATNADPSIAGPALLAIGTARYRTDDEPGALAAWQDAAGRPFDGAWIGWRSAAEQHVRDGNLDEAIAAYREADRRAPAGSVGPSRTASPGFSRRPATTSPRAASSTAPGAATAPTPRS